MTAGTVTDETDGFVPVSEVSTGFSEQFQMKMLPLSRNGIKQRRNDRRVKTILAETFLAIRANDC